MSSFFMPIIGKMEPMSTFEIIKKVLFSWQVIVTTIGIVLFINLVSYVAKAYRRPRSLKKININLNLFKKKKKSSQAAAGPTITEETYADSDSNDELGLEEA
ncbi:MAG: hypothetical protein FWD13_04490 [Treponema sp.]|nr:hypothetical protein [Treponema sp.]